MSRRQESLSSVFELDRNVPAESRPLLKVFMMPAPACPTTPVTVWVSHHGLPGMATMAPAPVEADPMAKNRAMPTENAVRRFVSARIPWPRQASVMPETMAIRAIREGTSMSEVSAW